MATVTNYVSNYYSINTTTDLTYIVSASNAGSQGYFSQPWFYQPSGELIKIEQPGIPYYLIGFGVPISGFDVYWQWGPDTFIHSLSVDDVNIPFPWGKNSFTVSWPSVLASNDTITGSNLPDHLGGYAGDDTLTGWAGDDLLDGGLGVDTLVGGVGNDIYVVDSLSDVVTENSGEGTDLVRVNIASAGGTYILGDTLENATLVSAVAYGLVGNGLDNVLTGNAKVNGITGGDGNDTLDGGAGADVLAGGLGDDVYYVDNTGDVVIENAGEGNEQVFTSRSYTLGANIESLTLTGNAAIRGTGNSEDNTITGNAKANTLDGGAGADTLIGGAGNDKIIDMAGDNVVIDDSGNTRVTLGLGADTVTTGAGNDNINAGDGDNVIDAGIGINRITSGSGDDAIASGLRGDIINAGDGANDITAGDGNNRVTALGGDDTIYAGIGNDNINAGDGDNVIDAGIGSNRITTGSGSDTITTGSGNDIINAGDGINFVWAGDGNNRVTALGGDDTIYTGVGNDIIKAGEGNNVIAGGAGNDKLVSGGGNDSINGGVGKDTLTGGAGNDCFIFDNLAQGGVDTISDFLTLNDVLVFEDDVFTSLAGGISSANLVVGYKAVAQESDDYLIFDTYGGKLYYDVDGNGAGAALQIALLKGVSTLDTSNLLIE